MQFGEKHFGLSKKLVLAILITGTIPLVAGLTASYYRGSSELQDVIGASFQTLAEVSASKIDAKIDHLVAEARAAAERAAAAPQVHAWLRDDLPPDKKTSSKFHWQPVSAGNPVTDIALRGSWITKVADYKSGAPVRAAIKLPDLHPESDATDHLLHISVPIYDESKGWPIGLLHFEYDIKTLFDPLIYPIRFGDTGHVMLINHQGTIISCPLLATGSRIDDVALIQSVVNDRAGWITAKNDGHGTAVFSIVGHAPLTGINTLMPANNSLHMFAWQDSREIFAPTRSLLIGVSIAGLLAIGLLAAMGYYASRRIVNPIHKLRQEARLIAAGDLNQPLVIKTRDEIEELASEFEKMRLQLRQHIGSLEEKVEERTQKLIESQAERERVMEQLIQTEKMAAVGTLASGIGHEINNPLYVITGLAEAIRDEHDVAACNQYGGDILKHSKDISAIVKNLSGYARPGSHEEMESIDIQEKILEAVSMVKLALLDDDIEIQQNFAPIPKISAKPEEIQQVFFNIVRNAVQAMSGKGTLELSTSHADGQVCIRIRDNGKGIAPEHLGRIFDPFFTTKGPDEGEGMGMFVVQTIINKYQGTINLESQVGVGTEFTICFPSHEAMPEGGDSNQTRD